MSECNVNQLSSDAACFTCLDPKTRDSIQTELLCQILTAIGGGGGGTSDVSIVSSITLQVEATDFDIRDLDFLTDSVDVSGSVIALDGATLTALENVGRTWTLDFATDQVDASGSVVALDAATLIALETVTTNQGTPSATANAWPTKITDGVDTAEVNTRTDGIPSLEVADDMTSMEPIRQALVASTDTTFTFSQPVRLVRIKNESLTATVFVRDGAISSDTPANAEILGVSPLANLPTTEYYPFKTTTIHLRSAGTPTVNVTGFY